MADWVLIPSLKQLFAEFDRIAPSRDHASDGSIGDVAHQNEQSDHNPDETGNVPIHDEDHINEVHAIDVDVNLNESDLTMEKVVQHLLARCRSGAETRLRYIIYNKRIWSASSDWVQKTYTGASPHTDHAHFSASYTTSLEASTASWHLEDIPVSITAADWAKFEDMLEGGAISRGLRGQPNNLSDSERNQLAKTICNWMRDDPDFKKAIAKELVDNYRVSGTTTPEDGDYLRTLGQVIADPWALSMRGSTQGNAPVPTAGVFGQILCELTEVQAKLDAMAEAAR